MDTCIGAQQTGCRGAGKANGQSDTPQKTQFGLAGTSPVAFLAVLWLRRRIKFNLKLAYLIFSFLAWFCELTNAAETNAAGSTTNGGSASIDTNGLSSFQVKRGFRIELVVSEPMVTAPVAMAFDENGRLFVVEMRGRDQRGASLGRVRLLDNMNPEGVFQNSAIYADNLTWPSAVACYAGGIFVAAGPDLLYLKDTKGDGIADARQVVMNGFGGTNTLDPNRLPNNFNWGPDNRIHAASGGVGGEISVETTSGPRVSIARCDFSFDPRNLELFPESGPAESGLSFDSHGRKFVSDFARPLMMPAYPLRYALRNANYPRPSALVTVADPAAPIYQFAPPSVPSSTSRRSASGNTIARFSSARGCVVYRGLAFPTNYFENVFIADPDAHLVHRLVLHENGIAVVAQRAADELNTEFLISKDASFRPVQLINGPDGALYLADYRDGNDQGRIYRILPEHFKRSKPPQLGKAKTYELVSTLAAGDGWHRDTAARLLYERKDSAAPTLLRSTLSLSRLPQARVMALQALAGLAALTEDDLLRALRDPDDLVREHAVRIAESFFRNGDASVGILGQLRALITDPSLRVRYQLAFTLGNLQRADKAIALGQLLSADLAESSMRYAVLSSALNGAGDLFAVLAGNPRIRSDPIGFDLLRQLATITGLSGRQDSVNQIITFMAGGGLPPPQAYELLYDLGDSLYRTRSSLALVDTQGVLQPFYSGALNLAADTTQPEAARTAATRLLGVSTLKVGSMADWLLMVCSPPTSPALQIAAVESLARYEDPQVVNGFLQMWPGLAPAARSRAISALLSRDSDVETVLNAIQNRNILVSDLSSAQRNFLRTHSVPEIQSRALQLLGPVPITRPEVMTRFKPALSLRGAPDRGGEIFRQRCNACHSQAERGQPGSLGPDLLYARSFSKEQLLGSILQPNLALRSDYRTSVVQSKEGQSLLGIVTDENDSTITLRQLDVGSVVWPQLNIRSVQPRNWSLMPDDLEVGLSTQDMADLIEFLVRGRSAE